MSSSKSFNFAFWLLAISSTPQVSADGIRATANRLRTFDGTDPATYMTSSVASGWPDYDKLFKSAGDNSVATLEELAAAQTNADEELLQEKDQFDAFIESVESIMIVDGMSMSPSLRPSTTTPSFTPTGGPSNKSSDMPPSLRPSTSPSFAPTGGPSNKPSDIPTNKPSAPTLTKAPSSTDIPSSPPSVSVMPSSAFSGAPSNSPSAVPSSSFSAVPSSSFSAVPTSTFSGEPSNRPSGSPSNRPSAAPSNRSSGAPSSTFSGAPSNNPSGAPSNRPSGAPSSSPSGAPSKGPTDFPTTNPTTSASPTATLSASPSEAPVTETPTAVPTVFGCGISEESRSTEILAILDAAANPLSIRNPAEPQGVATTWLIEEDGLRICPDDPNILQRWSVAPIYFSTGGDAWFQCSANPSAVDICGDEVPFVNATRFLSGTSECDWAGISCIDGIVTDVVFEQNNLVGTIPSEIGLLSNLEMWGMERGGLVGTIPTEIGLLSNLIFIDLDFNDLTGTLSSELLSLSSLNQLDVNDNRLSGSINGIGNFLEMEFLQLHRNLFTGTVPVAVGNFSNLFAFTLHGTSIGGTMPEEVCNLLATRGNGGILGSLIADCIEPTPDIVCTCCTSCRGP